MRIKNLYENDYVNYKKCSMFIGTSFCDWKCCKETGCDICQNLPLATAKIYDIADQEIVNRYMKNPLSKAIVFGGLEPFNQFEELIKLITLMRQKTQDDIVIYTGYYPNEIEDMVEQLKHFNNIIIKFGRFIPNDTSRYDEVLGVELASSNQYARRIS